MYRVVAREGALAPPEFGRSVNPIQTRGGGQIIPLTLLPAPQDSKSYLHLWFPIAQKMHRGVRLAQGKCYSKTIDQTNQNLPIPIFYIKINSI